MKYTKVHAKKFVDYVEANLPRSARIVEKTISKLLKQKNFELIDKIFDVYYWRCHMLPKTTMQILLELTIPFYKQFKHRGDVCGEIYHELGFHRYSQEYADKFMRGLWPECAIEIAEDEASLKIYELRDRAKKAKKI